MDYIVTHETADFDALSSLVAAKKLYPAARIVLPGSQQRNVREFVLFSKNVIEFENERSCLFEDMERLIVVDTRLKGRIGRVAEHIEKKRPMVVIYDHHPRMKGELKADEGHHALVGATVTMLAELIKEEGIRLTPIEATLMALGIYEETGSLTYRTTTKRDIDAVSYLVSQGANLGVVSAFLRKELSADELAILAELIRTSEMHVINGVDVAVTHCRSDDYIGELGTLVHKLLDVENFNVVFAFVEFGDKLQLMARSRVRGVNVNSILRAFHGGGHSTAASAVIREMKLEDAKRRLIEILHREIHAKVRASDIMRRRFAVLESSARIGAAAEALKKARLDSLPVFARGRLAGVISREGVNKAAAHNLAHSKVKGYMDTRIIPVEPDSPLHEIKKKMYDNRVTLLPVMDKNKLVGIITGDDVMRAMFGSLYKQAPAPVFIETKRGGAGRSQTARSNIGGRMRRLLPSGVLRLIKRLGRMAEERGCKAYAVGGFVRDILLSVKNLDIDIVLEGDAIEFGRRVRDRLGGGFVVHKRFGTAAVIMKNALKGGPLKVDLATARTETYKHPGALPDVTGSTIRNDLFRRDFTINAMAVYIGKSHFGRLIDFFGGERDIKGRRIRVLHDRSFVDDPTRIFRAVRFEQRYGFRIDPHTVRLIKSAVKKEMFDRVSGERLREEIVLLLKDKEPVRAIKRMRRLNELRFVHRAIRVTEDSIRICGTIGEMAKRFRPLFSERREVDLWLVYFMALIDNLTAKETEDICERFVMRRGERIRLRSCKERSGRIIKILESKKERAPSVIYRVLEPASYEEMLFMASKSRSSLLRRRIEVFLERYNGVRISVRGSDLKGLGISPGPGFSELLKGVLYAKIDGKVNGRREEMAYAKRMAELRTGE